MVDTHAQGGRSHAVGLSDGTHIATNCLVIAAGPFLKDMARSIGVDVPVFCVGKIADPAEAEYIVAHGLADMVCMTRAHIADPAIVRKLQENRLEDIRTCAGYGERPV